MEHPLVGLEVRLEGCPEATSQVALVSHVKSLSEGTTCHCRGDTGSEENHLQGCAQTFFLCLGLRLRVQPWSKEYQEVVRVGLGQAQGGWC